SLYMGALEMTKSNVGTATVRLGFSKAAAAKLSAAMAAQLVWTPINVVSQRLMVQGSSSSVGLKSYNGGIDAFRKIICSYGVRGLYRRFGISILTYAPSNAVWWASYSVAHRLICGCIGCHGCKKEDDGSRFRPDGKAVVAVQGLSATLASDVSALVTMPLDTIKIRLQVLDSEGTKTVRNLVKEGGFTACYRGLGPRWASMSISTTTMFTTYEFLKLAPVYQESARGLVRMSKRLSTKNQSICLSRISQEISHGTVFERLSPKN
ncbi:PREDICTED: solute carrier family 25 member 44-like, partial [Ipomoea nil]|uniref:solute carrier family 25 member 44-like n=1 Tax=Ipomoea nil TaxID=35883 RepID=UPI0009019865